MARLAVTRWSRPGGQVAAVSLPGGAGAVRLRGGSGAMAGFPDATNTGFAAWSGYTGSLTDYTGTMPIPASASGTTYQGLKFPGATIGSAASPPNNLTFRGCLFETTSVNSWNVQCYATNTTFEYCTFRPAAVAAPPVTLTQSYQYGINQVGAGLTVRRSEFWGFGNAFQLSSSSLSAPVLIEDCYMHDAADQSGSTYHHDGILSNNGGPGIQYITIRGNTIISGGNTNGIALQVDSGSPAFYSNLTVTGNLLSGWGYTVNVGGSGAGNQNVAFTDNTFSTLIAPRVGPLYGWTDGNGNSWRRNRWRVPAGAEFGSPADDGKFWWPDGSRQTTDYTG